LQQLSLLSSKPGVVKAKINNFQMPKSAEAAGAAQPAERNALKVGKSLNRSPSVHGIAPNY
jgi:hypothetical protein